MKTKWLIFVPYLTCVVMFIISIIWSNHVAADSYNRAVLQERRFCAVVSTLDAAYQATPPSSATGQHLAEEMHKLNAALGCNPG